MKQKDGGPAFPETRWDDPARQNVQWSGMTLRDYFAAKALAFIRVTSGMPDARDVAIVAYELADAMLEARDDD